jgi:tryptophan synthase alpha chain
MLEEIAVPDRLSSTFARCRSEGRAALVTYVMAGDPDLKASRAMALACVEAGADILELGMPFSDPMADGPTLQRASERSLASGTTLEGCLEVAAAVRKKTKVPIALMGYVNPVLAYGEARFLDRCREVGVDAVILPDLPPEEAVDFCALAQEQSISTVFLLAPTSTPARRKAAGEAATGFLYFVSVTGVTGARRSLPEDLAGQLEEVRGGSPVPVVVGFGVSTPEQAHALGQLADGVVVGSAIVSRIAQGGNAKARADRVTRFVRSLRRGLDPAPAPRRRGR